MGLKYLDGLRWEEVTRDERFFCQRLFTLIQQRGVVQFVEYLKASQGTSLDPASTWEIAYEACFYRDLWQYRGKKNPLFSPKRTFDLCLLSDDVIVVIEAKAHQQFDEQQLEVFERDKSQLVKETGVGQVLLAGLASSRYTPTPRVRGYFNGPYFTWRDMAELYAGDPILLRADAIYEPAPSWQSGQNNTGGYMTGAELLKASERGEQFCVGRNGGLQGSALADDLASGTWRRQRYETNREATEPPNNNWFRLSEWVRQVHEWKEPMEPS